MLLAAKAIAKSQDVTCNVFVASLIQREIDTVGVTVIPEAINEIDREISELQLAKESLRSQLNLSEIPTEH